MKTANLQIERLSILPYARAETNTAARLTKRPKRGNKNFISWKIVK